MNESYVIQGLTAAGTFLISLFAIFKYVINKTAKITENSYETIQSLSERHTSSMGNLVKDSVKAQEKVANAVDSLNIILQAEISNTPKKSDLELLRVFLSNRHDIIESKIDSIINNKNN